MEWWDKVEKDRDTLEKLFDGLRMPTYMEGQDIIQDVYEDIFRRGLDEELCIDTGFFVTKGRFIARDHQRKEVGRIKDEDGNAVYRVFYNWAAFDAGDEYIDNPDIEVDARAFLEGIPREFARYLYLYYIDGYTLRELEEILGIPMTTIRDRIKVGLRMCKEFYDEDEQDSDWTARYDPDGEG